jgi:predicted nucleic acid-binding Zn ribbon protein
MKKDCVICGKEFLTWGGGEKTCSVECRCELKKRYRIEYKKNYEQRVQIGTKISCIVCGKEFIRENKNEKTCSEKCKIERKNQIDRESFHRRDKEEYNRKRREYIAKKKTKNKAEIRVALCYDVLCDKCNRRLSDFTKIKQFSKAIIIEHAKFNGWIHRVETNENICPICLKEENK